MKQIAFLCALALSQQLAAQNNFQKIGPPPPALQTIDELEGLNATAHATADVDNDGDADIILAGQNPQGAMKCNLYLNNGSGAYQLNPATPFVGVFDGSIVFLDVEDDGDEDVIISGQDVSSYTTGLYINDGSGVFTLASTPFVGVGYSSLSIADVDGDLDTDVLICGQANSGVKANLYLNDGSGNFTLDAVASTTFTGIYLGTSEFGDVDGDGDPDLVLMGYGDSGTFSGMYVNDGNGVFTVTASSFPPLNGSDIAFSDIDDDTDMDMVIAGNDPNTGGTTKLYFNNGTGVFTLDNASSFSDFGSAWLNFNDVDSDGDEDLVICGSVPGLGSNTNLYSNDGNGLFTVVNATPFTGVYNGCVSFDDIDGDSDDDLVVTGSSTAKLYQNDGDGVFTAISTSPFIGLSYGAVELADVDNDGDLDAFMNGQGSAGFNSMLYLNDGNGGYSLDPANVFPGLANAAADFADIDNDGDVDLMMSGYGGGQMVKLFTNDGAGLFTEVPNTTFPPVSSGAIQFNDVDSDGDQDVFISGFTIFVGNVGQLWLNDGLGSFALSTSNSFEGANNGNIAFADIDGDNDEDLLYTGYGDNGRVAHLCTNNGAGVFTLVTSPFPGVQQGAIAFADVDNDEDMDLVIAGEVASSTYAAELYENDGTGTFTIVSGTPFEPTISSGLEFADIDNDLDQDLLTIGYSNTSGSIAKMYANDGSGIFTLITGTPFVGASYGMATFGDIDGDMDQDVIICGNDGVTGLQSNVYRNNNCQQSNVIFEEFACGPFTWIDGNVYTQNTTTATMHYAMSNSAGCDSVAVLHLTIGDALGVPTVATLSNVTAECEVTSLTAPTATMNCSGLTTGTTTQVFPITSQDTTEIVWTYTSPNGFAFTQTQLVIIQDVSAPVPDVSVLASYTSACPVFDLPVTPTSMDNCGGLVVGTTLDLPVTSSGTTTITWTFTDIYGNTSTQTQEIIYAPFNDEVTFDGTTLTATQASASYQWYDCNSESAIQGATNQTYNPTVDGSYAVTISNNDCDVTSNCFTITNLALNELALSNISIYPNPNTGSFTIETNNAVSISITNAAGQLVHAEELSIGKTEMNLKGLESGVYFVNSLHLNGSHTIQKVSIVK